MVKLGENHIGIEYSRTGIKLQETTHAAQYMQETLYSPGGGSTFSWLDGRLAYKPGKGHYMGAIYETRAYRVQAAYSKSSLPSNIESIWTINPNWVFLIKRGKIKRYEKLYEGYISINNDIIVESCNKLKPYE